MVAHVVSIVFVVFIFIVHSGNWDKDRVAEGHFLRIKTALIKKEELETKIQTKDTISLVVC